MSQQKAQLVSPIDTFTPPGMNVTGVVTATSFVGSGGTVTGVVSGSNLNIGVITATSYFGDGSSLTGVGASAFVGVVTAAQSGTTTIDLSLGNTIYFTQDTNTTVAFANTTTTQKLKFIRVKDDTTTARTIAWPASIIWNGGTAPTLIDSSSANDVQIFNLTTRDQGVTWYGYEAMKNDPVEPPFEGTLWAWGDGGQGKTGQNDQVTRSSPIQIPGTTWSDQLKNSPTVIKTDGTLWVWGYNNNGHLGLNDIIPRSSPAQIPGTEWSSVSKGSRKVQIALKTDGTMFGWGDNDNGKLGINDVIPRSSPVQIPGAQWKYHSGGENIAYATKTDGTLWFMGRGLYGSHGLNLGNTNRSSPTQIPGTQWDRPYASIGSYCGHFTKTDGTLWAVGENNYGNYGINDTVNRSSPIQVPGTWSHISGGTQGVIGVKSDGTLWAWGTGGVGSNGLNDQVTRSSPTQIPGTQWTNNAMRDQYFAAAVKSDGTLWVFGSGANLGLNDQVSRSSPTQVPGNQWMNVCATSQSQGMMATKSN
jgi:hypothetical protein